MAIGDYPAEYNAKVHGPYDPARYYGKPDTPLGEVKLGDLGKWFARRHYGPKPIFQALSRTWWRYQHHYIHPRYGGVAPVVQLCVGSAILFYFLNYNKMRKHVIFKHH